MFTHANICLFQADEDEEEEKETEDDQDGFFVPHGYLSDDEGIENEFDDEDQNNSEEVPRLGSADKHVRSI